MLPGAMLSPFPRRRFAMALATAAMAGATGCRHRMAGSKPRMFFTSDGRTGLVHADGSGLRWLDFKVPGQATWQPGPFLSDGRRVVFLSMEPRRDGPGRPFEEYYTQTPTHLWIHDLDAGTLEEIATRDRLAVFYTPALLLSDSRILVQVVRNRVGQLFSMNLDGSDAREFTKPDEGLPYGLSLSPDGRRVAFHLASPRGYEIWTCDTEGRDRIRVAGHPEHLYFGTSWSPDGRWIVFQDCLHRQDPGHDWSDVCVGRPDGSGHEVLTRGQSLWFAATYGGPAGRGGGSNMPMWTPDGSILCCPRSPEARVPWEFQAARPDIDHFNRDFLPERARGGTGISRINPATGVSTPIHEPREGVWLCRATASSDGHHLAYCRAETGGMPSLWVSDMDGRNARMLTAGHMGRGADHPRWLP